VTAEPIGRRRLLGSIGGAVLAVGAARLGPAHAAREPARRIDLQGHRGARWLLPENTLPGFVRTLEIGVTTLELDVVVTRDDVVVISHDPALNPDITRDADGHFLTRTGPPIATLTYAELARYDVGRIKPGTRYARAFPEQQPVDGARIPRLRDLFELVRARGDARLRVAIEMKGSPLAPELTPSPGRFAALVMAEVDAFGLAGRVQLLSFDWRTLQAVQALGRGLPTVYVTASLPSIDNLKIGDARGSPWTAGFDHHRHGTVPRMVRAAGGTHWSSHWRELDEAAVDEAHQLGLQVLAWTVNERTAMERMLAIGVDGIVTDRPDLGVQVLRERGLAW
jgi:glycerophosphoryl diester phosphodiesterase